MEIPALFSGNHILFPSPTGRVSVFSVDDALIAFNNLPFNTEVYAIDLNSMSVERVDCVARAVSFFDRMKEGI